MRLLKLPWLNHTQEHRKHEVYLVLVSPDGLRLASGGLDGKIRVWLVAAVLAVADDATLASANDTKLRGRKPPQPPPFSGSVPASVPAEAQRPLLQMGRHNGAVTVVRFDPTGRFLASGSDDKILLIWERDEERDGVAAFGDEEETEHWTVRKRAVAHDNDILDMAWAPDGLILVTVGLDRLVIVWSGSLFEQIRRFDVHQLLVKGIVFDPAGKFFATASDDRSVRVFRYHRQPEMDFLVEHVITEPFRKSPLILYFRRLLWLPDGQLVAVPNATNGPVALVAILNRSNWDSDMLLIGHDAPCEVVSFAPRLFRAGERDAPVSILATGGLDKTLAVWSTAQPRPLVVLQDLCRKTISDMVWTPDGSVLFVLLLDGGISAVVFGEDELGTPLPLEANAEQLHRYGADTDTQVFPETPLTLALERVKRTVSTAASSLPSLSALPYMLPKHGVASVVAGLRTRDLVPLEQVDNEQRVSSRVRGTVARAVCPAYLRPASQAAAPRQPVVVVCAAGSAAPAVLEVRSGDGDEPTEVLCNAADGTRIFQTYLPLPVVAAVGTHGHYWCLALVCGLLVFLLPAGRMLRPAVRLASAAWVLRGTASHVVAVTGEGEVHVWDSRGQAVFTGVLLAPVVNTGRVVEVERVEVDETGQVYVGCASGHGYVYSTRLRAWMEAADPWQAAVAEAEGGDEAATPLETLQRPAIRHAPHVATEDAEFRASVKLAYHENIAAGARVLGQMVRAVETAPPRIRSEGRH